MDSTPYTDLQGQIAELQRQVAELDTKLNNAIANMGTLCRLLTEGRTEHYRITAPQEDTPCQT